MNTILRFKNSLSGLLLVCATACAQLHAEDFKHNASATGVSQYVWRGFDLNQERAALQGDYTLTHSNGLQFGAWVTNYDVGYDDGIELDLSASYRHKIDKNWKLKIGITENLNSGDTDSSTELDFGAEYNNLAMTYFRDIDINNDYYQLDYKIHLDKQFLVLLHAGHNNPDAGKTSTDLAVTLSYQLKRMTLFASYSTNSLDEPGAESYLLAGITLAL